MEYKPEAVISSELNDDDEDPSISRDNDPSNDSQNPMQLLVPHVSSWVPSGVYRTQVNTMVEMLIDRRVYRMISQRTHVPSVATDTAWWPCGCTSTELTGPLCSLSTANRVPIMPSKHHTRTWPSPPPVTSFRPVLATASVVTPPLWQLSMTYNWRPVCGVKTRIRPSSQDVISCVPSPVNRAPEHVLFGTETLSSSWSVSTDQIRTSFRPAVANTLLKPWR